MKKLMIAVVLTALLLFAGCGDNKNTPETDAPETKPETETIEDTGTESETAEETEEETEPVTEAVEPEPEQITVDWYADRLKSIVESKGYYISNRVDADGDNIAAFGFFDKSQDLLPFTLLITYHNDNEEIKAIALQQAMEDTSLMDTYSSFMAYLTQAYNYDMDEYDAITASINAYEDGGYTKDGVTYTIHKDSFIYTIAPAE